ncbi:alkaline shock response membrane anchor protein AmaP [Fusobacterium perfoetens]|uniref:alkaline shock response membrane anchor protein AmaP n=1 Tax=Fusobacterium perfoetens TaxID=852 RepID=UPI0015A0DBCD|nr:alkaline shock response membrane anchor protein AmaP [Fusobacterium perfoetens]MCF2625443.1 alkaline shock response membrane anchor protein AmaP [Fusobacterium perfoetens]
MLRKVIFFFAWLGIFVLSIVGIVYVAVPGFLVKFNIDGFMWNAAVVVISLIYLFISLLKFTSLFSKEEGYVIKNENGEVRISIDSIKNIIKEILNRDKDVRNVKIICGRKGKKHTVTIYMDMETNKSIAEKTSEIQNAVKYELQDKLQLDVNVVEVKIKKLSLKNSPNA